ncbi:hypothetical protein AWH48_19340 [Domibacillus aminovorans]|uniref:Phage recombination protein Bet n=1 Tax=Domibacillus aminovorans TaxID=29332 RepID=A0A177KVK8_9BACI|nr:recombinase RecT [Domibacillus aminovorans]OAH57084.1 hypothetical protein AWH48_19340 [Domibacillus aminovorans]
MTTTKKITFTSDQKSLIWTTKLDTENANQADAKVFVELCESYGLNPFEGDILFQKCETQYGPRVQYTVTRDGHLKFAMKDPNFINILSCVVRKNDVFKVDVLEGVPVHEFSAECGEIVGAWCVVKHKVRGNMFVNVDFDEYFKAFSPKSPVWKAMPSAMIEKIAMVQGLRRSFPLGVQFCSEDEVIDLYEDVNTPEENADQKKEENLLLMSVEEFAKTPQAAVLKDSPKVEDKAEQKPTEKPKRKTKTAAEKKAEKEAKEANELKADTAAKIEEGLKAVPTVQPAHNIISFSRLSLFDACRFKWYLRYGLENKRRRIAFPCFRESGA